MSLLLRAREPRFASRARAACELACVGALSVLSVACAGDALIRDYNDVPIAVAQVVRSDTGQILEPLADGSLAPVTLPYGGSPVRVLLRGDASRDPDGVIREYRWLSAVRARDAGLPMTSSRRVPEGADDAFPADEATVAVELDQGAWAFSLWVRDDDGAWSAPDTVRVVIGAPAPIGATDGGVAKIASTERSMDGGPPTLLVAE